MRRFLWLALGALLLAGVAVASSGGATQAEARWVITDLGTLGGRSSEALAINDRGQVVGWSETAERDESGDVLWHAFLWQNGKMRDLGTFGGPESRALAITERGQVIGWSETAERDESGDRQVFNRHAFLWQNGKMRDLGTLGGTQSNAVAINDRGQVVGWSTSVERDEMTYDERAGHAFLWQNGVMTDLGTLGGFGSTSTWINNKGQVVGWSDTKSWDHAFLWQNGKMRDLRTLGGPESYALAINERGQVIGWSATKSGEHAFLWQNGKMRDLGTFGGPDSHALAINERGQVIGYAQTDDILDRAFLWQNGKMRDLATFGGACRCSVLDGPDEWASRMVAESWASAINGRGQVIGGIETKARDEDGYRFAHAFLWEKGKMTDLGTLPGDKESWAVALNNRGQILGRSAKTISPPSLGPLGNPHAVLWTLRR